MFSLQKAVTYNVRSWNVDEVSDIFSRNLQKRDQDCFTALPEL